MPRQLTSIILLTCNRVDFTRIAIDELYARLNKPENIHLIVCDDGSVDGTYEYLTQLERTGQVHKLISGGIDGFTNICKAFGEGMKYIESEYFITMFDDIVIPELDPDVIDQLIDLMEKNPDYGGLSCRIQRIPNMNWLDSDITPARKGLASYFRIQKKSDIDQAGGLGDRNFEEFAFTAQMRKINKKSGWASHLWCNHLGYGDNRGYRIDHNKSEECIWKRKQDVDKKPYPKIDQKTNKPLPGEKIYR